MAKQKVTYSEYGTWNELPIVILKNKINQEDWAKHAILNFNWTESDWSNRSKPNSIIPTLSISIKYKTETIKLELSWGQSMSRRGHLRGIPKFRIYSVGLYETGIKERVSLTYEGALNGVIEVLEKAIPLTDKKILEDQKARELAIWEQNQIQQLSKTLGDIRIERGAYTLVYKYRPAPDFEIGFVLDSKTDTYGIQYIKGRFTMDELGTMIKTVATCPSAVANRILGDER